MAYMLCLKGSIDLVNSDLVISEVTLTSFRSIWEIYDSLEKLSCTKLNLFVSFVVQIRI